MTALVALLPIAAILVLMLVAGWSAARAGLAGLGIAAVVAITVFDLAGQTAVQLPVGVAGVAAESSFTAVTILWIIGPALGIHHLQLATGATEVLRASLQRLSPDPRIVALLIAWFFALFMEGAAGFGTSVALAAPFLVGAGFRPLTAVAAALVGHAVGVSFGAVGTPTLPQVVATSTPPLELARAAGAYHSLLGWIPLVAMMVIVVRAHDRKMLRAPSTWGWTAAAGAAFFVPFTVLSRYVGPELPTLAGALAGAGAFVALLLVTRRRNADAPVQASSRTCEPDAHPSGPALLRASAPYLAVTGLVLVTRLITPVRVALQDVEVAWSLPGGFAGVIQPAYHPGTMLLLGLAVGAAVQRASAARLRHAARAATLALVPVSVALVAMLGVSRLMVHASMEEVLAAGAADLAGGAWPLLAPAVGALGTFVTGSATASNILFTDFQHATARELSLAPTPLLGAQSFGAAIGNAICPHNIVAASATVAMTGEEGAVLRRTIPVTLVYLAAGGGLALLFVGAG